MEKIEIEKKLKLYKKWDDNTIKILTEYILDFQEILNEYMPSNKIIEKLTENNYLENGIKFVDSEKISVEKCDASYSPNNRMILIDKILLNEDEKYIKYILFHEITHVISINKINDQEYSGFTPKNTLYCTGMNEAMTEYITQKRNKKHNYIGISDYRISVEQLENLMKIIGEKELIESYLTNPTNLKTLIEEKNMDFDTIRICFDKISGKDQTIHAIKNQTNFIDVNNIELFFYKRFLFEEYSKAFGKIDTIEKLKEKIIFFKNILNQQFSLNYLDEYGTYIELLCDIEELEIQNDEKEKLKKLLHENGFDEKLTKIYKELNPYLLQYEECDKNQLAIYLYELYEKLTRNEYCDILDKTFITIYYSFYKENPINNSDIWNYFRYPIIGKLLKENKNYNFEEIRVRKIKYIIEKNNNKYIKDYFYILTTKDKKNHILFEKYNDGTSMEAKKIDNNNFLLTYKNTKLKVKINEENTTIEDMQNNEIKQITLYDKK